MCENVKICIFRKKIAELKNKNGIKVVYNCLATPSKQRALIHNDMGDDIKLICGNCSIMDIMENNHCIYLQPYKEIMYRKPFHTNFKCLFFGHFVYPTKEEPNCCTDKDKSSYEEVNGFIWGNIVPLDSKTSLFQSDFLEIPFDYILKDTRNSPISFAMIDVDEFKKINDTSGHVAGDRLIKDFSLLLKSVVSQDNYCIRFGGDEFGVVFIKKGLKEAYENMQEVTEELKKKDFSYLKKSFKENPTLSIGISEYPADAKDKEELIKMADDRMYEAKRKKASRIVTGKIMQKSNSD